jgi:hypothetical protein
MALVAKVNTVTVPTGRIRLHDAENDGIGGLTGSADGTGSQGQIVFDDPDHSLTLSGFDFVTVDETDCTTAPRLFTGYLADRTTSRGKYPTDGGRQIDATINDPNTLLTWLLIGADGKRPPETRTARIAWLMGSDWWPPNVFDVGWIVPGSHDFDEADYRRQYASDVLSDILETYQTFFVKYDQSSARLGLFYGAANSTLVTSSLSISNDMDDVDFSTVFPPLIDASSVQDPSSLYSLVDLQYTGGDIRTEDTGTTAAYFSTIGPRGVAIDESRIGKATTATNFVNSYLAQDADEDETVTCSLILPSDKVGLIDAGDRINAKFVHLDGYEAGKYTRVKTKTLRTVEGRRDLYLLTIELNDRGPFGKGGGGSGGGGGTSNPPPVVFPPGSSGVLYDDCIVNARGAGTGTISSGEAPPSGNGIRVQFYNGDQFSCAYTVTQATDGGGNNIASSWQEYLAGHHFGDHSWGRPVGTEGPVTETWTVAGLASPAGGTFDFQGYIDTDVFKSALDFRWCAVLTLLVAGPDRPAGGVGPEQPPSPGQTNNRPELATMSGVNGTTRWPFADGTLRVIYDTIDQTPAIVSYDGAAGTFVMPSAPPLGTQVFVEYLGRSGSGGVIFSMTSASTSSAFETATANMAIDVIELAAGTYHWSHVRVDTDRSTRPLTIRPAAGATVIFDGTGAGTVNEVFTIGYVSAVKNVRFDGSPGRFKFQNYTLQSTGLVHTFEVDDFEFSHVDCTAISAYGGTSGFTEWAVYVSTIRSHRAQRLRFDDWSVNPGSTLVNGFQCYDGSFGPDVVNCQGWVVNGAGVASLIWGNGTGFYQSGWTITSCLYNRSHQNVGGSPTGFMNSSSATSTTNTSILTAPGITYSGDSFDK